jgi:F-box interacting protein
MSSSFSPEVDGNHSDDEKDGVGVLPEDQVFEILTRVPLDDLATCRMVSTRWRRITYEPAFAPLHCSRTAAVSGYLVQSLTHNRYRADFVSMPCSPPAPAVAISLDFLPSAHVRVVAGAAHRGLVCCVDVDAMRPTCYYVCKPATRQWRALPNPRVRFDTVAVAMEARPSGATRAEFKIVRFSRSVVVKPGDRLRCEVFDSRQFAWSQAPHVPLGPFSLQAQAPAVRAHGAMHWLRWSDHNTGAQDVFAFDVEAVKWRLIALPQEVDQMDNPWARKKIGAVEGRLCLLVLTHAAGAVNEEVLEVWEMANYGEGRWTKKMTISLKDLHEHDRRAVIHGVLHSSDVAFFCSFYRVMW